ncbi:Gfo/Idh/MocA family protein [Arthrobacter sp. NPDC090010]|uniref:Gfo/Idh/MocA family protein n=1 Tax=Arthrobacter sp. NPDC090010 TaxID=3363942 RepID=UPI00382CD428
MTQETPQPGAGQPLRVGVVGLGWAGQQHLEAYTRIPGIEVTALAAMETDQLTKLADEFQVQNRYSRWEDMLEAEKLDAISIAVPTFLHAPIAIAALERGIHVLSEKPIAKDSVEAQAMVDAARAAGRVLDVAFNHRRRGDILALKSVIDGGEIGRPYYAKAAWLRRRGIPTLGSWFTNPALAGGGPLVDIGVHVLDYALHLLGEPKVLSVSATTHSELGPRGLGGNSRYSALAGGNQFEVEDFSSAFLRLEGGGALLIEAGWASYRNPDDEINFLVYGTEGGAELRVAGEPMPEAGHLTVYKDTGEDNSDYSPAIGANGMHQRVVEDFVEVVRAGSEEWGRHDGSLALGRARIIDACYRSAREGREVQL